MDMCSSSGIGVDGFRVGLDFFLKLVENFEGRFAMDGSEVCLTEEGVLVINRACNWWMTALINYPSML